MFVKKIRLCAAGVDAGGYAWNVDNSSYTTYTIMDVQNTHVDVYITTKYNNTTTFSLTNNVVLYAGFANGATLTFTPPKLMGTLTSISSTSDLTTYITTTLGKTLAKGQEVYVSGNGITYWYSGSAWVDRSTVS